MSANTEICILEDLHYHLFFNYLNPDFDYDESVDYDDDDDDDDDGDSIDKLKLISWFNNYNQHREY